MTATATLTAAPAVVDPKMLAAADTALELEATIQDRLAAANLITAATTSVDVYECPETVLAELDEMACSGEWISERGTADYSRDFGIRMAEVIATVVR